jgi:hypothetical protein
MTNHPEAALRALAEHGLRCDMNPTHDMSSQESSEAFWHEYMLRADKYVRRIASSALDQMRAAPSPPDSSQGEPVALPVYVDSIKAECGRGQFSAYALYDAKGRILCDTLNADDVMIHEEPDEESLRVWDETGRARLEWIAARLNTTPPPSSPQVADDWVKENGFLVTALNDIAHTTSAVAEFEDGAKCPLCGWRNTAPAPQSVALNWRCDGFDHHGRVVAVEKIERRRFHVYALKDDRWQADFYADHELPEYIEVGKYPDARSAMRACDDFLHEGDTVDYSGGGDFDPTKLRSGEDEEATPQSAPKAAEPVEPRRDLSKCPRCGGVADNGHDRCVPPNPYWCSKCSLAQAEQAAVTNIDALVTRFLSWRLPDSFGPDCYVTFDREKAKANNGWPVGTNIFTADEAKAMLEYVLAAPEQAAK